MKKQNQKDKPSEELLVEIIPSSKIKEKDILILRCKKGEERKSILEMREELKAIIQQKDLRILAVSPDTNFSQLSILVQAAKEYEQQ